LKGWSRRSKPAPATRSRADTRTDPRLRLRARIHAALLLAAFAITVIFSHAALKGDRFLGARFAPCEQVLCVDWVMPTTWAWTRGARAGDPVVSIDGKAVGEFDARALPRGARRTFTFRDRGGPVRTAEFSVIPENSDELVLGVFGARTDPGP